ncbi:MAG TPA: PQQ-binding-like beta-propeller repeat protein [Polyangia bacterium]|nr:PQQ-binding-like beta-propeller repeat protein [Polyangia bacterium]
MTSTTKNRSFAALALGLAVLLARSDARAYSSSQNFSWFSYHDPISGNYGLGQLPIPPYTTTMWNYDDGYCFVTSTSDFTGGIRVAGGGSDTAYMTLDAQNNYVLTGKLNGPIDWMQFGGDSTHAGNNPYEALVTLSTVGQLAPLSGWAGPGSYETSPVFLSNVSTPSGNRNLGFISNAGGNLIAFDAKTGATIWQNQGAATGTRQSHSTPAIDPSRSVIYGIGRDGNVHMYDVGTGNEHCSICSSTLSSWPQTVSAKPDQEMVTTALTLGETNLGTFLYVGTSGTQTDSSDYQGALTSINVHSNAQKVFNGMCSHLSGHLAAGACTGNNAGVTTKLEGAGLWARGGFVFDPGTQHVIAPSGNGFWAGGANLHLDVANHRWPDTLYALNADGSGANNGPVDSYTPSAASGWDDLDLGSTNVLVLANNGTKYPHLAFLSGKDGYVRLVNLDNMSGQSAPGKTGGEIKSAQLPLGSAATNNNYVTSSLATWINPADGSTWVFVPGRNSQLMTAYQITADGSGSPVLTQKWTQAGGAKMSGAFIVNGVAFYHDGNDLIARNATTGAQVWPASGAHNGVALAGKQSPVVVNGILYYGGKAFSVGGTAPTFTQSGFIGATCLPWSDLNSNGVNGAYGQVTPGSVYTSGAAPGTSWNTTSLPDPAPAPKLGRAAQKSGSFAGEHQHYFYGGSPLPASGTFNADDKILVWVYLPKTDVPAEVMLQFFDTTGSWEHRGYWGANDINWGTNGTVSRTQVSTKVPSAGSWQQIGVTASQVGLTGKQVSGMAFTLFGGSAYWDDVYYLVHGGGTQIVWVDDAPPAGALLGSDVNFLGKQVPGDGWVWTTSWTNNATTTTLAGNNWDMCQISGFTGPFPASGSGRNVVLSWPGETHVFTGDFANTTSNWVLHESSSVAGDGVSTSCVDFGLTAYTRNLAAFGWTYYTQSLMENSLSLNSNTQMTPFQEGGEGDDSICYPTGYLGYKFDSTASAPGSVIISDFGDFAWHGSTWGPISGAFATCYAVLPQFGGGFTY